MWLTQGDFGGKLVLQIIPVGGVCQNKCRMSIELGKKRRKIVVVPLPRNGVDCYSVGLVSVVCYPPGTFHLEGPTE